MITFANNLHPDPDQRKFDLILIQTMILIGSQTEVFEKVLFIKWIKQKAKKKHTKLTSMQKINPLYTGDS